MQRAKLADWQAQMTQFWRTFWSSSRRRPGAQWHQTKSAHVGEGLEVRLLLSGSQADALVAARAQTAFLPVGTTIDDFASGLDLAGMAARALSANSAAKVNPLSLIVSSESEPNNSIATADLLPLGFDAGEDVAVDISGTLTNMASTTFITSTEDDGSIPLANATGLTTGQQVQVTSTIGNGPFAATTGDFDVYRVDNVQVGQLLTATVNGLSSLDPMVAIYDAAGNQVAFNDDASGVNSFVLYSATAPGSYYILVTGYNALPTNPFDSGSGSGVGSTGTYTATIGLDAVDQDYFAIELNAGDIFGANLSGAGQYLELFDSAGTLMMGSSQDFTSGHPSSSPLPGGGNAALSWVIASTGTYYVRVTGSTGAYTANTRVYRPTLESEGVGTVQTLFLDFDGATIDASIFGGTGVRTLSALRTFLPGWGLTASDESAVIDAIIASITETFQSVADNGNNGDFFLSGTPGAYGIRILNSRDDADPFGQPNVSRLIIGGTIAQLGISTIGIAETIDVGNFDTTESAVILLDLLSASAANPNSLNQYALGGGATIVDLIGVGVGNIAAHEAGHFFGSWHTNQFNGTPNIMDQGGNLANTVGVGLDNTFGTADDIDVDFVIDQFVPSEGFTGREDTMNATAFGLSSGTLGAQFLTPFAVVADDTGDIVRVFDINNGTVLASFDLPGDVSVVGDIVLTPDSKLAFVGTNQMLVYVIDLENLTLGNGGSPIGTLAYSEDLSLAGDGQLLFVGGGGGISEPISIIDVSTLTVVDTYLPTNSLDSLTSGADGSVIVASRLSNEIRRLYFDSVSGKLIDSREVFTFSDPRNVYVTPDGRGGVVVGGTTGTLTGFNVQGLLKRNTVSFPGSTIIAGAFSPDGKIFYARGVNRLRAYSFDPATGTLGTFPLLSVALPTANSSNAIETISVSRDGTTLYLTEGANVVLRNAVTGAILDSTAVGSTLTGIAIHEPVQRVDVGSVWGVQPATGLIIRIDPLTGVITDSFAAPGNLLPTHRRIGLSMAESGRALIYVNSDDTTGILYRLDPTTGAVLTTNSTTGGFAYDSLSSEGVSGTNYQFLGHGDLHRQVNYSGPETFGWVPGTVRGGLGGDDNGRQFGYFFDGFIHEYSPLVTSSTYISSLPSPATDVEGMAFDGTSLFVATASGSLYTLNPNTGAVLNVVTVPTGALFGLGAYLGLGGPTLTLSNTIRSLPEDTDISTRLAVADLNIALNGSNGVTTSLTGPDAALFQVLSGKLYLRAGTVLDYETNPLLDVIVQIEDPNTAASPDDFKMFTIVVTDVNEAPVATGGSASLPENSLVNTLVGTVTGTDPDFVGTTLTYSIQAGNTGGAFSINSGSGEIRVANSAVLDFETTPVFTLTIEVRDSGTPSMATTVTFTVTLTNENESPVINDATFNLDERSPVGAVVGSLGAVDPDSGTVLSYTITAGNTGGAFAINASGQLVVADSAPLLFLVNPQFTLTVHVSDNGTPQLQDTAIIQVNLNDINEIPVVNALQFALVEQIPTGTFVGTATGSDVDGTIVGWSIVGGNPRNAFSISSTGVIRVNSPTAVNFETNPVFNLTVQATDDLGGKGTGIVTITLSNVIEQSLIVFDQSTRQWRFGYSDGATFAQVNGPQWLINEDFASVNLLQGDFDGDGDLDVAGRSSTGVWLVGLIDGQTMKTQLWGNWPSGTTWSHVTVGDFNGDGKSDVLGQAANGEWWLAESTGTTFNQRSIGKLPAQPWLQYLFGDFNGDGTTDLATFNAQGRMWVSSNVASGFTSQSWVSVGNQVSSLWMNFLVGDFNNDGTDDITAQQGSTGQWWKFFGQTTNRFQMQFGNRWDTGFFDFHVGDFNGDGRADIAARTTASNAWWINYSTPSGRFNAISAGGRWTTDLTWTTTIGDFNGDGKDDIGGMNSAGAWFVQLSDANIFRTTYFGKWLITDPVFSTRV